MTVVVFNPYAFLARYPEFSSLDLSAVAVASVSLNSSSLNVSSVTSGVLTVGQGVLGSAGIQEGTTISSLGTGTGGTGTYNLSLPAVASISSVGLSFYIFNILPECFKEATFYVNNTDGSIVTDIGMRTTLLNMITAHILALNFGTNGQQASPLVGAIKSAREGSVSVNVNMLSKSEAASWWNQTKYGAAFWRLSATYRMMRYISAPRGPITVVPRW